MAKRKRVTFMQAVARPLGSAADQAQWYNLAACEESVRWIQGQTDVMDARDYWTRCESAVWIRWLVYRAFNGEGKWPSVAGRLFSGSCLFTDRDRTDARAMKAAIPWAEVDRALYWRCRGALP